MGVVVRGRKHSVVSRHGGVRRVYATGITDRHVADAIEYLRTQIHGSLRLGFSPSWELVSVLRTLSPSAVEILEREHGKSLDEDALNEESAREYREAIDAAARLAVVEAEQRLATKALIVSTVSAMAPHLGGLYPPVPMSGRVPIAEEPSLPEASGVYFIWRDDVVQYVGQSINLSGRVKASHEHVLPGESATYVLLPREELNFAESFYIGVCRPPRNFGLRRGYTSPPG